MDQIKDTLGFSAVPWSGLRLDNYPDAKRVPTMLAVPEQQFYIWIAHHWASGEGAIADLGAFVGGSTARLAAGAKLGQRSPEIHAYDHFTANEKSKRQFLYKHGVPEFEGEDILPLAMSFLQPWEETIHFHRGPIQKIGWCGDPIELLVIDVFKKVRLIGPIVEHFFPSLVTGQSLVIQQDYMHWAQPWICAQMARLAHVFEPVAFAEPDSVAFHLRRDLTVDDIEAASLRNLTDEELLQGVIAAKDVFEEWGLVDNHIEFVEVVKKNPGIRAPWQMKRP